MHYTTIPGTDLQPSVICLGGGPLGSSLDRASSFRLLDAFLDRGGNFLDSAKVYADWVPGERSVSEKTIGRWIQLRRNRDRVIIATKGAHPELATMHIPRLSPQEIASDVDASLSHLQVDTIDLYWLHRDDAARPVAGIIETLNAQVRAGKIRYFGCSNWRAERIRQAQAYAAARGLQGFSGDQMLWSLARPNLIALGDPTIVAMDDELAQVHASTGLAAIPYSSQAGGLFNKLARDPQHAIPPMYQMPGNAQRLERIRALSAQTGLTITQVVLGYLLSHPFTTIPVVGCHTIDQLDDSLRAVDIHLTPDQISFLTAGA
jgi:aryl-alcohol dehydrogenase-like predicted oxidoreductase